MNPRPFSQVVVWQGTIVGLAAAAEFEKFILEELGTRAKYLKDVLTKPDLGEHGSPIPGTGSRCDALFAVHEDDVKKFALPRFKYGMRWLDDVFGNGNGHLYPAWVAELLSWNQLRPPTSSDFEVKTIPDSSDFEIVQHS